MAVNIKFDITGNPEPPTIILANRNGNKLGQLDVDVNSIELIDKFNDASEFSFTLNKYVDGELIYLWDKVVNFKLVYCKEWDMWFEITVELDEATETVKTVFCTQLGQAELSQIMLYDIEINTERDIERDDYKITILYDPEDSGASLLGRLLEKAPHYSVIHVDSTIANIQRSFSFDDTSIYDAFQEIAEEIGCLFVFNSDSDDNGYPRRTISVYDLQQTCSDCGHRGEFTEICPKCSSTNIKMGYGKDTLIFVSADELASNGIQLTTDIDSVKNCFKLEAGDDLMTATVRNRNPNGTDYIWYFSDDMKEDMPEDLVYGIEGYDETYNYYKNDYVIRIDEKLEQLSENETKTFSLGADYQVGDVLKFTCPASDASNAKVTCRFGGSIMEVVFLVSDDGYARAELEITNLHTSISVNESVSTYMVVEGDLLPRYNKLVEKYKIYNKDLEIISNSIVGYSSLMNAYYNTIDLGWYLKSGLMPNVEMSNTDAEKEAKRLFEYLPILIGVNNMNVVSLATANSAILALAKTVVRSDYRVQIKSSQLITSETGSKSWSGILTVTNYSDEEDTSDTGTITRGLTDKDETLIKQKLEKELDKENTDDLSITGLFAKELEGDNGFKEELKKYALKPLTSFHDACQVCIDILIEQGIGSKDSEGYIEKIDSENNLTYELGNIYEKLYVPYYNKLLAIESEMKLREDEINIVLGVYDLNGDLISDGLQTKIEKCKNDIQKALNFQDYLGEELWLEFCAYRREDKYSNDNYISDGLNNAELFERALEFYEAAENEIYKSSELQHSISSTLNNLLAIPKFRKLVESFEVGNWIRVRIDEQIYKLRLLEYRISYGDFNNIPVEFSDVTKIKNGITDVQDVLSQASSIASSYDSVQRQATQGNDAQNRIRQWLSEGLDASLVQIQNNTNEDIVIDNNGLLGRSYSDIMGEYSDEQIKLTHNIIAYTDDNWKTVRQAIGKHSYQYYDEGQKGFVKEIGYGMSADFVTAGIVSGSQIIGGDIYSDNYKKTETTNEKGEKITQEEGSYINLRDGTFSFGGGKITFNDNTLTINPDNKLGLTESEVTTITENCISTTDVIAENLYIRAANIKDKLTVDQIEAFEINAEDIFTDNIIADMTIKGGSLTIGKNGDNDTQYAEISENGKLTCAGANITGVITATDGSFTGAVYADEGHFSSRVTIGGTMITAGYLENLYNYAVNGSATGDGVIVQIAADTGSVGDWNIESGYLGTNTGSGDVFLSQTGVSKIVNGISNVNCVFYSKGSDENANFAVDTSGKMYSTAGYIGGWSIEKYGLDYKYLLSNGTKNWFFLKPSLTTQDYTCTDGVKRKLAMGLGNATTGITFGATLDGELYAGSGHIGGWTINSSYLGTSQSGGSFYITSASDPSQYWIRAHDASNAEGTRTFSVSKTGILSATGATISGTFTSSGDRGIVTINNGYMGCEQTINGRGTSTRIATSFYDIFCCNSEKTFIVGISTLSANIAKIGWDGSTQYAHIYFTNDNAKLYGTWLGTSSEGIPSDETKKNSIETLNDSYEILFDNLNPVAYKYNDGTSGRIHTGYTTQGVLSAIETAGLTTNDFAGYIIATAPNEETGEDETSGYLRYDEFVSLNTWQIQKLKARVAELEAKIESLTNN